MTARQSTDLPDADDSRPTNEVGSEGGSPGDLELERSSTATGSEAGETWQPATAETREVRHDETGRGRRLP